MQLQHVSTHVPNNSEREFHFDYGNFPTDSWPETKRLQQTLTGKSSFYKRVREREMGAERGREIGREAGNSCLTSNIKVRWNAYLSRESSSPTHRKKQLPRHGKSGAIDSKSTLPLLLLLLLFHLLLLLLLTVDCVSPGQS